MSPTGAPTNLDRYLLELSGTRSPLVCFVPTASADDPTYVHKFLTSYSSLGVRTMVLTLWQNATASVEQLVKADIVIVGGGSTVNLMALWGAHGVDRVLLDMMNRDRTLVLAGLSAGASCWYSGCVTDSFGDNRAWHGGLGVLPYSFCPHWNGEKDRQPVYAEAVASGVLGPGYAVDDGAALHWTDGILKGAFADRPGSRVIHFEANDEPASGCLAIESLPVELL